MSKIDIGALAPAFTSTTDRGEIFSSEQLKGSPTVLYFYPKDNTSGCTLEAKSLRDGKEELQRRGYKIIGVSPDSVKSHQNFCAKHELNFTLLADISTRRRGAHNAHHLEGGYQEPLPADFIVARCRVATPK